MKTLISLTLISFLSLNTFAQEVPTIEVQETKAILNKDTRNAFVVEVYCKDQKDIEKALKKAFKDKDAKVDVSKEIFADNAVFKSFGTNNTVDVYAKIEKKTENTYTVSSAVNLGGAWLSSSTDDQKVQAQAFKTFLRDFAVKLSKDAVHKEVDNAKKVLSKKEGSLKDLQNGKADLEKDIKDREEDIKEAKRKIEEDKISIEENAKSQTEMEAELEKQREVVKALELKEQAVK